MVSRLFAPNLQFNSDAILRIANATLMNVAVSCAGFLVFTETILPKPADACVGATIDEWDVGMKLDINNLIWHCGEFPQIAPYKGSLGVGSVVCSSAGRDTNGRRALVVDGIIVAIRQGMGMKEYCSWGREPGTD